ncbi:glycosyltransferase family 2 protein [Nocardioides sp. SR21]|uniref:glycosyltransferase family 2 protein n=1 Tax=Nocardioides sp. SR21 TaxID=2919501 RepID=UPI001FAADF05|nr:galactosyltransferase-related protein [Nocardioides sp. SR21]
MSGTAVVTIAHGRHQHLLAQHHSLARSSRRPDVYVLVAMGDRDLESWSVVGGLVPVVTSIDIAPEGLPLAAARNLGMSVALAAGCDVLIGLDVDCLAGPGLVEAYAGAVRADPESVWSGPVTYLPPAPGGYPLDRLAELDDPHPGRPAPAPGELLRGGDPALFWSLSFALSASAWAAAGGFDEAYVGYGAEDTDFGRRVVAAGLEHGWVGAARAYHQHHPTQDPPVSHLDDILRNGREFHRRWGEWPMGGWLTRFEELGLVVRQGDDWIRSGAGQRPTPER